MHKQAEAISFSAWWATGKKVSGK